MLGSTPIRSLLFVLSYGLKAGEFIIKCIGKYILTFYYVVILIRVVRCLQGNSGYFFTILGGSMAHPVDFHFSLQIALKIYVPETAFHQTLKEYFTDVWYDFF